jgi:CheY-like chemotaxis protein
MDRKRLLVVDDEAQIVEMIGTAFEDRYDIMTAASGEEAIRRAVLDHPSCILMDVMMPQMGGFVLLEILKSIDQTKLIPVVMVSAKPRHETWDLAQEMGAMDYVEKPFTIERISEAVTKAIEIAPIERRRTPRVKIKIPIIVRGRDAFGKEFEMHSETEDVSRFGALVRLPIPVLVGERVEICQVYFQEHEHAREWTPARVVWHLEEGAIGPHRHGLEFLSPSSSWVVRQ